MTDKIDPQGDAKAQEAIRPLRDRAAQLRRIIDDANVLIRDLTVMGCRVEIDVHTFETIEARPVITSNVLVEVR